MHSETITYKGYKVEIHTDEGPENPFEAWDCEPPLLTYYGGRHSYAKSYNGAPETIREVLDMVPDSFFERGERVKMIKDYLNCTLREFAEHHRSNRSWNEPGSLAEFRDVFASILEAEVGSKPEGWSDAKSWFETAEGLLKLAGVPCLYDQSTGYCQGDVTLCLIVLTPEWIKKVGCAPEYHESQLKAAIDLYSAWAWGDVYGVSSITAPGPVDEDGDETEGEEVEDGSCWGYYGRDHEKSGLMEHVRSTIDWHIEEQAKEASDIEAALCSAD